MYQYDYWYYYNNTQGNCVPEGKFFDLKTKNLDQCNKIDYKYYINITDNKTICFKDEYPCPNSYSSFNSTTKECHNKGKNENYNQEKIIYYNINDIMELLNITEEKDYYDTIIKNIDQYFMSSEHKTLNLDKGFNEIFLTEKLMITLTTTQNEKNNINNNFSVIDLGKCEELLKSAYNISYNNSLYIKKFDIIQEGMKIPKIEFDIYYHISGDYLEKLNLSICENSKIYIYTSILITDNIDIYNPESDYYKDICYPAETESGADITLKDRKNEFIDGNKTLCQEDCDFDGYDSNIKKVKCLCIVKESSSIFFDMKINKTKLLEAFKNFKDIPNIKILNCYKALFSKFGIKKNIGFYLVLILLLFHIIFIFIFYYKDFEILKNKIKDIFLGFKKNKDDKIEIKKENMNNRNIKETENINQNQLDENFEKNSGSTIKFKNTIKKRKKKKKKKKGNRKHKNNIGNESNFNNNQSKEIPNIQLDIVNDENNENKDKKKELQKNCENETIKYSDEEMNDLEYNIAIKYDKRTYIEYYFSLLKTQHDLLFTFYNNADNNSKIIKIDLFLIGFVLFYTINALFFTDETMHQIYEDQGSFNFIFQISTIIYSTIITIVINTILKFLALTSGNISDFKKGISNQNIDKKNESLKKKIKIKFILYFIISTIFILFFWYYLALFGAVFRNTQVHLIKDTLVSFAISLISPFGYYLLPGLLRIPALSDQEKKRKYLYIISKWLQML